MGAEVRRQDLDGVPWAPTPFGHWKLVIGHSIQIIAESFVNILG
jgi:hypothetical protein